jgi:hypothetical protein
LDTVVTTSKESLADIILDYKGQRVSGCVALYIKERDDSLEHYATVQDMIKKHVASEVFFTELFAKASISDKAIQRE